MSLPIDNSKKALKDLEALALTAVEMFKKPKSGMGLISDILVLVSSSGAAVNDLICAWPEFADLDKEEASQLGGATFDFVKAIVDKVKASSSQPLLP